MGRVTVSNYYKVEYRPKKWQTQANFYVIVNAYLRKDNLVVVDLPSKFIDNAISHMQSNHLHISTYYGYEREPEVYSAIASYHNPQPKQGHMKIVLRKKDILCHLGKEKKDKRLFGKKKVDLFNFDFCDALKEEDTAAIIETIRRYGNNKCAAILTFSPRSAMKPTPAQIVDQAFQVELPKNGFSVIGDGFKESYRDTAPMLSWMYLIQQN
jgi:hypothetical protein